MNIRVVSVVVMLSVVACAPVAEPETPPPVAPTKRTPQREPFPPAPSNMPEIVYASVVPQHATNPPQARNMR